MNLKDTGPVPTPGRPLDKHSRDFTGLGHTYQSSALQYKGGTILTVFSLTSQFLTTVN